MPYESYCIQRLRLKTYNSNESLIFNYTKKIVSQSVQKDLLTTHLKLQQMLQANKLYTDLYSDILESWCNMKLLRWDNTQCHIIWTKQAFTKNFGKTYSLLFCNAMTTSHFWVEGGIIQF